MIYIVLVNLFAKDYIGIKKKIFAQMKVFANEFGSVYYTSYSGQMIYLLLNGEIIEKEVAITKDERNRWILEWMQKYSIQKAYIRYDLSDKWFLAFMRDMKERNIISVLEFPTIPYDGEIVNKRVQIEDEYYRQQLSCYVDQCTSYGEFDSIFGIPCISLLNGVDLEQHPLHKLREPDGKIVLMAVAAMSKWHGYERVIEGLADYYKNGGKEKVFFRLIGEGAETDKYRRLVCKYNLEEFVEFCGRIDGEALNHQYDDADIAIGSLAMYKKNVIKGAPIKTAEYCVRGIPFIYGYDDDGLTGNEEFVLQVSNDDQRLDIQTVIDFYNHLKSNHFYVDRMRQYAIKKYSWSSILKEVIEYMNR